MDYERWIIQQKPPSRMPTYFNYKHSDWFAEPNKGSHYTSESNATQKALKLVVGRGLPLWVVKVNGHGVLKRIIRVGKKRGVICATNLH